jgi:hypothetical protein
VKSVLTTPNIWIQINFSHFILVIHLKLMSSSGIIPHGLMFHDVSLGTSDKSISALIRKHLANTKWKIERGVPYRKSLLPLRTYVGTISTLSLGKNVEDCQRVYISLTRPDAADEFMRKRPFHLNERPLQVMRSLPKSYRLYDRCVTGLKITIHSVDSNHSTNDQVNESDLKKHFRDYGSIRRCQWTNPEQTEALFLFDE